MKIRNEIVIGLTLAFWVGALFTLVGFAATEPRIKCYTKVNLWYEDPEEILSTNYHKGAMLPVGSYVEILKQKNDKIRFRDLKTNVEFKLVQVKKYTNITPNELFSRYFSKDPALEGAEYKQFSQMEKDNIRLGSLAIGMSKDAVIMAYGYPPTHRTPTLAAATWTYWKSRFSNFQIQFDVAGKIVSIQG